MVWENISAEKRPWIIKRALQEKHPVENPGRRAIGERADEERNVFVEPNSRAHRFNPVKHVAAPQTDGCYLFSNPFWWGKTLVEMCLLVKFGDIGHLSQYACFLFFPIFTHFAKDGRYLRILPGGKFPPKFFLVRKGYWRRNDHRLAVLQHVLQD